MRSFKSTVTTANKISCSHRWFLQYPPDKLRAGRRTVAGINVVNALRLEDVRPIGILMLYGFVENNLRLITQQGNVVVFIIALEKAPNISSILSLGRIRSQLSYADRRVCCEVDGGSVDSPQPSEDSRRIFTWSLFTPARSRIATWSLLMSGPTSGSASWSTQCPSCHTLTCNIPSRKYHCLILCWSDSLVLASRYH